MQLQDRGHCEYICLISDNVLKIGAGGNSLRVISQEMLKIFIFDKSVKITKL